jgi:hypothetical protein
MLIKYYGVNKYNRLIVYYNNKFDNEIIEHVCKGYDSSYSLLRIGSWYNMFENTSNIAVAIIYPKGKRPDLPYPQNKK